MAELENKQAIVPATKTGDNFTLTVKTYDAAGRATELTAPMPESPDFGTWTLMQQIVMLKRGMWKTCEPTDILWGLAYARKIDADPMKGELFPTGDGRWGTSNKFKIKKALESGRIEGISVDMKVLDDPGPVGCASPKDLECTVTIHVKGWKTPLKRVARLSRWFKKNNPNWVGNPEHMLELNTVAHACEYIAPGGVEDDEAPPLAQANPGSDFVQRQRNEGEDLSPVLEKSIANVKGSR